MSSWGFPAETSGFPVLWLDNESYVYPVTEEGKLLLYKGDLEGNSELVVDKLLHITDGALIEGDDCVVTLFGLEHTKCAGDTELEQRTVGRSL
ncbi:MAG: hypothetical protein U5K84_00835 [Alkalibacterium sp.]|nr:hypothetical protein [Alkalibacterium sp.]